MRCIRLVLLLLVSSTAAAEIPVHFTLDATATYGIGTYSALGGQLHFVAFTPVWRTEHATGTLDLGLLVGVQDEPQFLQYTSEPYRRTIWCG